MSKIIRETPIYRQEGDTCSIDQIFEEVATDVIITQFRLTFNPGSPAHYYTTTNQSRSDLLRLAEIPMWQKQRILDSGFIK